MKLTNRSAIYWHRFLNGLPVTVHLLTRDRTFLWTRIYGVQLGPWFIGCIKWSEQAQKSEAA